MTYSFVALLDKHGRRLPDEKLSPVDANLSFNAKDAVAEVFLPGRGRIARLTNARIAWIEAGGIRVSGTEEEMTSNGPRVMYQEWHFSPSEGTRSGEHGGVIEPPVSGIDDEYSRRAVDIVTPFGLLGGDHDAAVEAVAAALRGVGRETLKRCADRARSMDNGCSAKYIADRIEGLGI